MIKFIIFGWKGSPDNEKDQEWDFSWLRRDAIQNSSIIRGNYCIKRRNAISAHRLKICASVQFQDRKLVVTQLNWVTLLRYTRAIAPYWLRDTFYRWSTITIIMAIFFFNASGNFCFAFFRTFLSTTSDKSQSQFLPQIGNFPTLCIKSKHPFPRNVSVDCGRFNIFFTDVFIPPHFP